MGLAASEYPASSIAFAPSSLRAIDFEIVALLGARLRGAVASTITFPMTRHKVCWNLLRRSIYTCPTRYDRTLRSPPSGVHHLLQSRLEYADNAAGCYCWATPGARSDRSGRPAIQPEDFGMVAMVSSDSLAVAVQLPAQFRGPCRQAGDGVSAFNIALELKRDVIVMDVMMP